MEDNPLFIRPLYKSKKDILNKILRIKTEQNDNISQFSKVPIKYPMKKKYVNLGKKNLTCQNFLEYTYNYNDITEKKIKMPDHLKIKQKYELITDYESHSAISKKPEKKKIMPLLITGLNTPDRSKYKKFQNIFSSSQKSLENNSELKTKSSSKKFTKSNFYNNNSSNKNDFIFPSEISKPSFHFHGEVEKYTKNDNNFEGLKAFVQKSRIILKEKIINRDLLDKLIYQNDVNKEEINVLNKHENKLYKNLELFNIYKNVYLHYLRELKEEEAQERRFSQLLKNKKTDLEIQVSKLNKKIENLQTELIRFESIKRFFRFSKSNIAEFTNQEKIKQDKKGTKADKEKKKTVKFKEKEIDNKKIVFKDEKMNELRKDLQISKEKKSHLYRRQTMAKRIVTTRQNYFWKYNSIKPIKKVINLEHKTSKDSHHHRHKDNDNNNDNNEIRIKKTYNTRREVIRNRHSKKLTSMMVHKKQYERMFTDVESLILEKIGVNDTKRNEILEEKKTLQEEITIFDNKIKYTNEVISQKENILLNLKDENQKLINKLNSLSKIANADELAESILDKKMVEIITNLQLKINVQEITNIKNLISMIKLNPADFLIKYKTSKFIFMIKTIELIITHLISKKNKYLSEPKLKEALKNFLFILENDKKNRMNQLNKKLLKKGNEEKLEKALDRATRIRFLSYRKFDLSHFKNKRNKFLKEKESNKTVYDNQYENWILYD